MLLKKIRRSLSIGAKTLLSHVTLAVVVIALASVISYTLSSQYIRQTRVRDLTAQLQRLAVTRGHYERYEKEKRFDAAGWTRDYAPAQAAE